MRHIRNIDSIVELANQGKPVYWLSRKKYIPAAFLQNWPARTLYGIIKNKGFGFRGPKKFPMYSSLQTKEIVETRNSGVTWREISKLFKIPESRAQRIYRFGTRIFKYRGHWWPRAEQ